MTKILSIIAFIGFVLVTDVLTDSLSSSSSFSTTKSSSSSSSSSYSYSESTAENNDDDGSCSGGYDEPNPTPSVTCGPDEVYDGCVNGGCGRWNCSQPGVICIDLIEGACREGCRCKEGCLRADDGSCVPEDKCPAICTGSNEVSGCKTSCPESEECDGIGKIFSCPLQSPKCIPACLCKKGYYRNKIGECISKEQCLKCNGPHEYYSCGGACDNVCKTLSEQNQTNCPIINVKCNEMCYCEKDYARASNGTCIPIDKCPPKPPVTCGPDEVYDGCVNGGCGRWNCSQPGVICIDLIEGACREGCRCKEGYLRADDGSCVPEDKCPAICTGSNEVSGCKTSCPETEECDGIGKIYNCPLQSPKCIPACLCKKGYYRNKIGECISKEQCLKCNGPHEYYSCGGACDNVCKTLSEQNQTNCPIINVKCNEMCYCEKDYARASNGTCIPIDKCPPKPPVTCGLDEVYDGCVNGGCGRWNCSQPGVICIDLIEGACIEGCRCKEGYLRADDGTCIPEDKCPAICTGSNEVSGCKTSCPETEECDGIGKIYHCPLQSPKCIPACLCKKGYYRNKIGECISKEQCLKCNGPHEYYSCGGACDNVCKTLSEQNQTNCPIVNVKCNEMCYCEKDYARASNGTCIPIDKCPPKPPVTCGPDEVYDSCVNGGCGRFNCSRTGIICIDVRGDGCREGCSCKEGYLRNDEGTCIPEDKCPAICTGLNEVSGCKSACPIAEQCESIDKKINCPIQRRVCIPACRCKEGYYRNKIGECISKKQCLKCNGPHEYYSCGGACDNICKTLSKQNQTNCPIVNIKCNEMCYCEKDYARASNGTCIPIDKCPVNENGNGNENGIDKFSKGNEFFTEYFLSVASNMNPGISAIYSPFSLLFLLAQLALYANGLTLEQLLVPLNINKKQIRTAIPKYLNDLYAQQNVNISLAERVYVNEKYKLSAGFKKDSKDIFHAEAQNLDFGDPTNAAKDINSWVANQTHDLIETIVNPSDLDESTRIVLVNALYFKSDWRSTFKKQNTKKSGFYLNKNKNVTVDMMYQEGSFNYAELSKPNIQAVELPYKNPNFTLLVLLPKSKDGLGELIASVGDTSFSVLQQVKAKLKSQSVALSLPSIKTTTTTNSKTVLEQMNIKGIFYPETANLTGMLEKYEPLYVSAAIQKATITLDENGTEATAANAVVISARTAMLPPPVTVVFIADHPFAYFIMYNDKPIFCGVYAGL